MATDMEMGLIPSPVRLNISEARNVVPDIPLGGVVRGTLPVHSAGACCEKMGTGFSITAGDNNKIESGLFVRVNAICS